MKPRPGKKQILRVLDLADKIDIDEGRDVGLIPNQVQAITWLTWKRIHKIYYPGRQLHLLHDNSKNLWKIYQAPEDIKPFPWLTTPALSMLRPGAPPVTIAESDVIDDDRQGVFRF